MLSDRVLSPADLGSLNGYRFPLQVDRAGLFRRRLECKDASGRQIASIEGLAGFLKFTYEIEWESEARQRLEQEKRSFFAAFHPYELSDGERALARFEPLSTGCLSLFRATDWVGKTGAAQALVRKRWFTRVDPAWPALESGEFLEGRVDYQVHVGANAIPLFTVRSSRFGALHVVNRLSVTASPEEERLALMSVLLALAHRHLRSN